MMPTETIGENIGDDYSGTEDSWLQEAAATTNKNLDDNIAIADSDSEGDDKYGIISFSGIDSLPGSLTVSSATMYLYQWAAGNGNMDVRAHALMRNWAEASVCWSYYTGTTNWTTAGAKHEEDDRDATITFTETINTDVGEYKALTDEPGTYQLAADIEDMADGTRGNYGWVLIELNGDYYAYRYFRDSEYGSDGQLPYLSVTYTETTSEWDTHEHSTIVFS